MIYECIQCQARQLPGDLACPHCGAQFAGPVPADATLEDEPLTASPFPDLSGVNTPPPPTTIPPPMSPPPLSSQTLPPTAMPTTTYASSYEASGPSRLSVPPLLLISAVVGLLAIIGIVYVIFSAGQTAVTLSTTAPPPAFSPSPSGVPITPTHLMTAAAAGTAPAGDSIAQAAPIGRWMTTTFDFYEFDKDGTGTRGSVNGGKPATSFSWTVMKNQLILDTDGKGGPEKVPFSYAPGGTSLYLRQPNGQYLEYARAPQ